MDKSLKKLRELNKTSILNDNDLHVFLEPIFPVESDRKDFIKKCTKKLKIQRMLLRAQCYTEIADDQGGVRHSTPALKLIFLMALAEYIAKDRINDVRIGSFNAIKEFFKYVSEEDRKKLYDDFRWMKPRRKNLSFLSILKILYEVRNRTVHGEDFFSFSLLDQEDKRSHEHYSFFAQITSGYLGTMKRKRRVSLNVRLTYEELRDIFRRTAIANIKQMLV